MLMPPRRQLPTRLPTRPVLPGREFGGPWPRPLTPRRPIAIPVRCPGCRRWHVPARSMGRVFGPGGWFFSAGGGREAATANNCPACCAATLYQARYCSTGALASLYVNATDYAFPGTFYFLYSGVCYSVSSADTAPGGSTPVVSGQTTKASCTAAGCPPSCSACAARGAGKTPSSLTVTIAGNTPNTTKYTEVDGDTGFIKSVQYFGSGGNGTYTLTQAACGSCIYFGTISDTAGSAIDSSHVYASCPPGLTPLSVSDNTNCKGLAVTYNNDGTVDIVMGLLTTYCAFYLFAQKGTYTDCFDTVVLGNNISATGWLKMSSAFDCSNAAVLACLPGDCNGVLSDISVVDAPGQFTCGQSGCGASGASFAAATGATATIVANP